MATTPPPTPPVRPTLPPPPDGGVLALGQVMTVLGNTPKYRQKILGLIQDATGVPVPELDVARAAEEKIGASEKALLEKHAALEGKIATLEARLAEDDWATQHDLTADELAELKTYAKEKKVGDPDFALQAFRSTELGRPRGTAASGADLSEDERKDLYKRAGSPARLREWVETRAQRVLTDLRRGRRRA